MTYSKNINNKKQMNIPTAIFLTVAVGVIIFQFFLGTSTQPNLESEAGEVNPQAQLEEKAKELEEEKETLQTELEKNELKNLQLEIEKKLIELEEPEKKVLGVETQAIKKISTPQNTVSTSKLNKHEKRIYKACNKLDMSLEQTAFVLANANHETAGFKFLKEIDGVNQAIKLGYQGGSNWYGRGYIQLTHKNNYSNWSKWTGRDLVSNPDLLITDLDLSAHVACSGVKHGSFTAKGTVEKYINKDKKDYYNARDLINGDKNYRAGCEADKCWTIGTKIKDLTNNYINKLTK